MRSPIGWPCVSLICLKLSRSSIARTNGCPSCLCLSTHLLIAASKLPRFAYFPFGGGPRQCIGAGFATMEAVLLLATIAARFELQLEANQAVVPVPSFTLRPKHGIRVSLHQS